MPLPIHPYTGNEPFLYVSFAHGDTAWAHALMSRLARQGLRLWYDENLPLVEDMTQVVSTVTRRAHAMLILASQEALNSHACCREWISAVRSGIPVYILFLTPVYPSPVMKAFFDKLTHVPLVPANPDGVVTYLLSLPALASARGAQQDILLSPWVMPGANRMAEEQGGLWVLHHLEGGVYLRCLEPEFIIGRSKSKAQYILSNARMSREHLKISKMNGQWFATDLFSKSKSYFNGGEMTPGREYPLQPGTTLNIAGDTFLVKVCAGQPELPLLPPANLQRMSAGAPPLPPPPMQQPRPQPVPPPMQQPRPQPVPPPMQQPRPQPVPPPMQQPRPQPAPPPIQQPRPQPAPPPMQQPHPQPAPQQKNPPPMQHFAPPPVIVEKRRPVAWLESLHGDGKKYTLDKPATMIGRSSGNDICLELKTVGRKHAQILLTSEGYILEDLGSVNGTSVNNRPVVAQQRVLLRDGDVLAFHTWKLRFHLS